MTNRSMFKSVAVALAACSALLIGMHHASALPNNKDAGLNACLRWCYDHNKTDHSMFICFNNCYDYYRKHPGLSPDANYSPVSNPPTVVNPPRTDAPPLKEPSPEPLPRPPVTTPPVVVEPPSTQPPVVQPPVGKPLQPVTPQPFAQAPVATPPVVIFRAPATGAPPRIARPITSPMKYRLPVRISEPVESRPVFQRPSHVIAMAHLGRR